MLVDVGQQVEIAPAVARGRAAGADDVIVADLREEFAAVQVAQALKTNALYEGKYPLVSALSRPVIAEAVACGRARARRRRGRPRLHRQGQRPAPLRDRAARQLPGRARDRAAPRPHLDARGGDRLRARARHPGRADGRLAVLDRRQPPGPLDRGRDPRGPVDRAARGPVRAHGRTPTTRRRPPSS